MERIISCLPAIDQVAGPIAANFALSQFFDDQVSKINGKLKTFQLLWCNYFDSVLVLIISIYVKIMIFFSIYLICSTKICKKLLKTAISF